MTSPRRWRVIGARLEDPAYEDEQLGLLSEALLDLGGRAVQEMDGWFQTHIDAEMLKGVDDDELLRRVEASTGFAGIEVRSTLQDHEDWAELWKRGLEPRRIGQRLIVTPSWTPVEPAAGDIVLTLDPGMAFGNAEHGTTRGCLRLLERAVRPGQKLLDVGAGSAVLAIAAAHLGADRVLALEADPWAIDTATENVSRNGVADRVEIRQCLADVDLLASLAPVDGVIANIEAGVLDPLISGFRAALASGGWLIMSGLLASQLSPLVDRARAAGFELVDVDADGEWRSAWLEG